MNKFERFTRGFNDMLDAVVRELSEMPKRMGMSYLLCIIGFFGPAGFHRIYLGKPISGILYFLTWGFFCIGTIIDLFRMEELVHEANTPELR